jgi:hypothetical protein
MLCFMDKTYCTYETCSKWIQCPRAFGVADKLKALAWWGKPDPPICVFADKPDCFEENENGN